MATEIKVPAVGESIKEVQVAKWMKKEGDSVALDEPIVELETEKTTVEVPAPVAGQMQKILVAEGQFCGTDAVLGVIDETAARTSKPHLHETAEEKRVELEERFSAEKEPPSKVAPSPEPRLRQPGPQPRIMPSARRVLAEQGVDVDAVKGTGPGGRILKEDVMATAQSQTPPPLVQPAPPHTAASSQIEVVPMSPLRLRIAQRLVEAQQNAALLTTFNEIDMHELTRLRHTYQEQFQKEYGIKLGLMSFFVKASVEALKRFPQVNAEIRGREIVYHNHYDIGIAIGSGKGLVVPILRNAEMLSLSQVEHAIAEMAQRVQEKKLTPEELEGGTFTISNGGIYGSLLSTPIVNPPQSGILGMHTIQDRPVARDGQVVIRPMMYVALTYDHRLIDGREAVGFLKHIKDLIEEPSRILLEI